MIFLIIFIFVLMLVKFNIFRYVVFHLFEVLPILFSDIYKFFKYKRYNECHEFGKIRLNSAKTSQVFGCGKTLSLVRAAVHVYKKYNNKIVWSEEYNKFVIQHIHIISNVRLFGVPYIPWESEQQFIDIDKLGFEEQDITIFLLDEVGTIFNSRKFRENISMEFLTRLLQSRKNKMALYMTSQRFQFTDKILRESCSTVTTCKKYWRFIELCDYDAYDAENVVNVSLLRPIHTEIWFAHDKDYQSYDSFQLIESLRKDNVEYLSTNEILETYGLHQSEKDLVKNSSYKKHNNFLTKKTS